MTQVVVTRPAQDAEGWVSAVQSEGFEAIRLPLLHVLPILNSDQTKRTFDKIQSSQALMFVSANAARMLNQGMTDVPAWKDRLLQETRSWCTGPGTAAALRQMGVPAHQIDQPALTSAHLDSEALWDAVKGQVRPGFEVLFIRGADESGAVAGRDWLEQQLESAGAKVSAVAAYQRLAVNLTLAQKLQVQDLATNGAIWLFSSSACLQSLVRQCPDINWSQAKLVVTHPRIAALAQQLGWQSPTIAPPGIQSLLASIKSLT
jgi:uroporphyrinogen-III synthase